jgi:hypothetical protein
MRELEGKKRKKLARRGSLCAVVNRLASGSLHPFVQAKKAEEKIVEFPGKGSWQPFVEGAVEKIVEFP